MSIQSLSKFVIFSILFIILIGNIYSADTLNIFSPSYFGEEKNIYEEINYLEEEFLSFQFCSEDKVDDVKFTLSCSGDSKVTEIDVNIDKRKDNCFYSNYEIETLTCDDFSLEITYNENNKEKKIKRNFKKQKQSMLINHILGLNYKLLGPVDLSYYLAVLNDVGEVEGLQSMDAYEKLKNDRNNKDKCWTSSSCSIDSTSKILTNLKLANYELDSRLLEDGSIYLEKNMINNDKNPLKFKIEVDESDNLLCELIIDDERPKEYELDNDSSVIEKYSSEKIVFTCNQTVEEIIFSLYNLNGKIQYSQIYEDQASFSYDISPFACVGKDNDCDYTNTINTLIIYENDIQDNNLLENYIDSLVVEDDGEIFLDTKNKYEDIGKYLYFKDNVNLLDYLKFHQNNDGSWGTGAYSNRISETSWAIMGMQETNDKSSEEYIKDAKRWIYYNEPLTGWGSVEKNSLAYLAIKEQLKPYVKISTENYVDGVTSFSLENPTIYKIRDIKVKFSDEIIDNMIYSENHGDLDGEEKIFFNVSISDDFYGHKTGEMIIKGIDGKNNEIELVKMPISIKGPTPFSLVSDNYTISDDMRDIVLGINNNIEFYSGVKCEYQNPFTNNKETIDISSKVNSIKITNPNLSEGNYNIEFNCNFNENLFVVPVVIDVSVAEKSFEIGSSIAEITSFSDFSLSLSSIIGKRQIISVEVLGDYNGVIIPSETEKVIAGNDVRDLFFSISNPTFLEALGNSSSGSILITSDSGYAKEIPIIYNVAPITDNGSLKWIIGITSLILIFVVFIFIRYRQYKENSSEHIVEENHDDMYFDDLDFK